MIIKITDLQKEYLELNVINNDKELLKLFKESGNIINIEDDIADEIRDLCCEKLDYYGFDNNYNKTTQGEILEELIDVFYK